MENQIITKEFIQNAIEAAKKKDEEGLTLENFNNFPS
jgi:hypothetical protein